MSGTNEKYPGLTSCQAMNCSSLETAPPGLTFPPGSQSAEPTLIQEFWGVRRESWGIP